jgi:hypothetical protein
VSLEQNLRDRIFELEAALANCRKACVDNIHEPGNEHDTFDYVESVVNAMLFDCYVYEAPEDDEDV